jgi:hypothetical protein
MNPKVLKELQDMFADAARTGMWGTLEIDFQRGEPVVMRVTRSKKLYTENDSNAKQSYK